MIVRGVAAAKIGIRQAFAVRAHTGPKPQALTRE